MEVVTDEGKVIYTTVQEGYKEGIQWLHELVTEHLFPWNMFSVVSYEYHLWPVDLHYRDSLSRRK